jgi:hypothetical protein
MLPFLRLPFWPRVHFVAGAGSIGIIMFQEIKVAVQAALEATKE